MSPPRKSIDSVVTEKLPNGNDKKLKCKILVLGPANAGKSTLIRNVRIIHDCSFTDEEIQIAIENIRAMTMEALVELIKSTGVSDNAPKELRQEIYSIMNRVNDWNCSNEGFCIDPKLISQALRISRDPMVQECLNSETCRKLLNENCCLLANIETNLSKDYYPSHDDILTIRKPTKVSEALYSLALTLPYLL